MATGVLASPVRAADIVKVGIVGNSHLAALKLALKENPERYGNLDISFWGMPGGPMAELTAVDADGVLSASGGPNKALEKLTGDPLATFDPRHFDVVVIYGFSLVMQGYLQKFADFAEDEGISSQLRRDAAQDDLSRRFAFRYAKQLQLLGKKVIVHAAPYRSERMPQARSAKVVRHLPEAVEFATDIAKRIGAVLRIQPQETVVESYFTSVKYAASPEDNRHMNAAYGVIVLDVISDLIGR